MPIALGDIEIDLDGYAAWASGRRVELTVTEQRLLTYLLERPNVAVSRRELLGQVWEWAPGLKTRAVDNTVRRLRTKIEANPAHPLHLQTVYGVGYRLKVAELQDDHIVLGPRKVDLGAHEVLGPGAERAALSEREVLLMQCLVDAAGASVDSRSLLARCWSGVPDSTRKVYDAIARLRGKLEDDPRKPRYLVAGDKSGFALRLAEQGFPPPEATPPGPAEATPADLPLSFGRYRLLDLVHEGPPGRLFEAELLGAQGFSKRVGVRLVDDGAHRTAFLGEATARAVGRHANLVDVYELGEQDGLLFVVLEWVGGTTLRACLDHGAAPGSVLIEVGRAVTSALAALGEPGCALHPDLSPDSVRIDSLGMPKLDLGPAAGGYLGPERWAGAVGGARTVVFSVGLLLYEMATGRPLLDGDGPPQRAVRTIDVWMDTAELAAIDHCVPGLSILVRRCLWAAPERRWACAAEVGAELERLGRGCSPVPSPLAWLSQLLGTPTEAPRRARGPEPRPNAFFGRSRDLAALRRALLEHRLVTVLGPPGVGKTRLAEEFARGWEASLFVARLGEVQSALGVLAAVCTELELPVDGNMPESALAGRVGLALAHHGTSLLVLDNAEHLVPVLAPLVDAWSQAAPDARFLVTSRVPLGCATEQRQHLAPFAPPSNATAPQDAPGVALFVARARAIRPDFAPGLEELETIGVVVDLLDGLPLGIELAAGRLATATPATLLRHIQRSPLGLTDRRQRGLRASLDVSWALLSPWERATLAQCTVFVGSFDHGALDDVLDLEPHPSSPWIFDVVTALVEQSLLQADLSGPTERLSMLRSVAEYAAGHLSLDARRSAEHRHARHFAALCAPGPDGDARHRGTVRRRGAVALAQANLRVSAERAVAAGWAEEAAACCCALLESPDSQMSLSGKQQLGLQVLALPVPAVLRARLHRACCEVGQHLGTWEQADAHAQAALALHREQLNGQGVALALSLLADAAAHAGELDLASVRAEQGLAAAQTAGGRRCQGILTGHLGSLARDAGRSEEGNRLILESLAMFREAGDREMEASALAHVAIHRRQQGLLRDARALVERALALHRAVPSERSEGLDLTLLGGIDLRQGRTRAGIQTLTRALLCHRNVGGRTYEGLTLTYLSRAALELGELNAAEQHLNLVLQMPGETPFLGLAWSTLGLIHRAHGRAEEGRAHCIRAAERLAKRPGPFGAIVLDALARALLEDGLADEAWAAIERAEQRVRGTGDLLDLAMVLCTVSAVARRIGKPERCLQGHSDALDLHQGFQLEHGSPLTRRLATMATERPRL
jgi:DNA-binding response OmpR family regulator/predicted ATPase/tetratricopeptide (TPR) repeat protein